MNGDSKKWGLLDQECVWENESVDKRYDFCIPLIVLLRVRNEESILEDTLDHLSKFADIIVAYDDASIDNTLNILKSHPKVGLVVENKVWLSKVDDRLLAETRHRGLLLQEARKRWNFLWCMCCDADERYVGNIRRFVMDGNYKCLPDAIRIQLFDAYMTPSDSEPFMSGQRLLGFRKYFGPERRDVLMLWKNSELVSYCGLDSREPIVPGTVDTRFYCQHYGKSLSVEHWESTCDYYINHFPYEPYGKKWAARKGKAIHLKSDFGRALFPWGETLFQNSVKDFQ